MEKLENKIAALNRQLRLNQLFSLTSLLIVIWLVTIGAKSQVSVPIEVVDGVRRLNVDIIETKGLFIKDLQGNIVGGIQFQDQGGGHLYVKNGFGQNVFAAFSDSVGNGASMVSNKIGQASVFMTAKNKGGNVVVLDADAKAVASMRANIDRGVISIVKDGIDNVSLSTSQQGGVFNISNSSGARLISIGATQLGGGMSIHNVRGTTIGSILPSQFGLSIKVNNTEGNTVASIHAAEGTGGVSILGESGQRLASLHSMAGHGGVLGIYSRGGMPVGIVSSIIDNSANAYGGTFSLLSESGNTSVSLSTTRRGGRVTVWNEDETKYRDLKP
jgi:hypothetical protein